MDIILSGEWLLYSECGEDEFLQIGGLTASVYWMPHNWFWEVRQSSAESLPVSKQKILASGNFFDKGDSKRAAEDFIRNFLMKKISLAY